jgi:hypothetical protein
MRLVASNAQSRACYTGQRVADRLTGFVAMLLRLAAPRLLETISSSRTVHEK